MTTTWATDAQLVSRCVLAPTALSAYSDAYVAALGGSAITTFDIWRVEAQRQILLALRSRGILGGDVTRAEDLRHVEIALALALLFESVAQFTGVADRELYAQQSEYWRSAYERDLASAAPVDGVRPTGASFEWGRG